MVLAVMFTTSGMLRLPGLWMCAFPVSPAALSEQEGGKPEATRGCDGCPPPPAGVMSRCPATLSPGHCADHHCQLGLTMTEAVIQKGFTSVCYAVGRGWLSLNAWSRSSRVLSLKQQVHKQCNTAEMHAAGKEGRGGQSRGLPGRGNA